MDRLPGRLIAIGLITVGAFVIALNMSFITRGSDSSERVSSATPHLEEINLERETMFYERLENNAVRCNICFRNCVIQEGERGFCRNRENVGGTLYNIVYGKPSAVMVDPVEKEPQFHFLPGSRILCLGSAGCNFRCRYCHNWHLSQRSIEEIGHSGPLPPEEVVNMAKRQNVPTISFTYNEPTSLFEYLYDVAKLARAEGIRVIFHSNGSMSPEPLRALLPYVDSVTIDLKGFTDEFYEKVSDAQLAPVKRTLEIIREEGVWLEVVNLVVPTLNDDANDIRRMCEYIHDTLGADTPLHFTRFFPNYRLTDLPPTPVETLEKAHAIARDVGLKYVYLGNVPGHRYNSTFCPHCGETLINRYHFSVHGVHMEDGHCRTCGEPVSGIWE